MKGQSRKLKVLENVTEAVLYGVVTEREFDLITTGVSIEVTVGLCRILRPTVQTEIAISITGLI